MAGLTKFVTVIVPCREEEKYIARTLESILANDYPQDRLELLVVDGMSTDGTREIVAEFSRNYPFIKLLDNPKRITPAALNIGISEAQGDIIMRVDSHGVIPPNYISGLVAWQEKTGADNVGGVCLTLPGNDTDMAKAIAVALSYPFGVGNAYFRIGAQAPSGLTPCPLAVIARRSLLASGLLTRTWCATRMTNLICASGKTAAARCWSRKLSSTIMPGKAFSRFGACTTSMATSRPWWPGSWGWSWVCAKSSLPFWFSLSWFPSCWAGGFLAWGVLGVLVLLAYVLADVTFALRAGRGHSRAVIACLLLVFPALHFSYGLGFLQGLVDFFLLGKKGVKNVEEVPLSR